MVISNNFVSNFYPLPPHPAKEKRGNNTPIVKQWKPSPTFNNASCRQAEYPLQHIAEKREQEGYRER